VQNSGIYYVRLGDGSLPTTIPGTITTWRWGQNTATSPTLTGMGPVGVSNSADREACDNWADNYIVLSIFLLRDDYATVQEFYSVEIPVLANDIFPDGYIGGSFSLADSIVQPPVAGVLQFTGSGIDSRIIYMHDGHAPLTNGIDSLKYAMRYYDTALGQMVYDTATVYVFVLQPATGTFAACYGTSGDIILKEAPASTLFYWFNTSMVSDGRGAHPDTAYVNITGNLLYYVEPRIASGPYAGMPFPAGRLEVSVTGSSSADAVMRWTGLLNTDWRNPNNWVEVKAESNGYAYEAPVYWAPVSCVDVVISPDVPHYPELWDSAWCHDITVQNRAMLKNPHALDYRFARVEIKLNPSERDRFVMWSAPLMNMYSGDYHFKDENSQPRWGDVFMNYFQQANPGGGTAAASVFTATFGELNEVLGLGRAFNVKVTPTSVTKEQAFLFPQPSSLISYTAANGVPYATARTADSCKFITYGRNPYLRPDTTFALPVTNPNTGYTLIQVVNPYLAYLSFARFQAGNTGVINGYYLWSGDVNESFIAVLPTTSTGNRYSITAPISTSPDLIPPLQSFLVRKSTPGNNVLSLWMSPNWTTTLPSTPYLLRVAPESDPNTLRIKVTQGSKTSYAILVYDPNTSPALGPEDMPVLIYDDIPLTLYSYTALREPLAIHTSNDFRSDVNLGLRIRDAGEAKLEFSGLSGFGHNAYLIDREKNREVDLQQQPEYIFTVTKTSGVIAELNSRFSLRMEYTGVGLSNLTDNQAVSPASELVVYAENGVIHVRSTSGPIRDVQVYNMVGGLLYRSRTAAEYFRIPAARGEVYIIKAQTGKRTEYEVRKVWVK